MLLHESLVLMPAIPYWNDELSCFAQAGHSGPAMLVRNLFFLKIIAYTNDESLLGKEVKNNLAAAANDYRKNIRQIIMCTIRKYSIIFDNGKSFARWNERKIYDVSNIFEGYNETFPIVTDKRL